MMGLARFTRLGLTPVAAALKPVDVGIFYGTHTGMSHEYAKRLNQELGWRLGLNAVMGPCDDYDFSSLGETSTPILFFLTSYGQGEPTKNAKGLWSELFRDRDPLPNLEYSVLGRGSSAYATFNYAGIQADARLSDLGANRLAAYAQTDRLAIDNEEPYYEWKEQVIASLKAKYNKKEQPLVYKPSTDIKRSAKDVKWDPKPKQVLSALAQNCETSLTPEYAPVTIETSVDSIGRKFVHATFDLSETSQTYETGDYLNIWPANSEQEVDMFLKAFGLDGNQVITVNSQWQTTFEGLAKRFLDINAKLGRENLKYFLAFAPSEKASKGLAQILGSHDEFEQFSRTQFNVARALLTLSDNQPWTVPDSLLLDVLPRLHPRDYSISSTPEYDASKVSIGLVVENNQQGWNGVASNYLSGLRNGDKVALSTEYSDFKLPADPTAPIIMVGIGTGASPFRGFVQDRQFLQDNGISIGRMVFFGGFKTADAFQYKDFFDASLAETFIEYSQPSIAKEPRLVQDQQPRRYVQQALLDNEDLVYDLIDQGAYVYVCGSGRLLGHSIRNTLIEIVARGRGISLAAAKQNLKLLKRGGRFKQDLW